MVDIRSGLVGVKNKVNFGQQSTDDGRQPIAILKIYCSPASIGSGP
jgi:hypothetical protein